MLVDKSGMIPVVWSLLDDCTQILHHIQYLLMNPSLSRLKYLTFQSFKHFSLSKKSRYDMKNVPEFKSKVPFN